MHIRSLGAVLLFAGLLAGCSGDDESPATHVEGRITVADSLDSSGDYSGIGVTILHRFSADDTLYHAETDSSGYFSGESRVPAQDRYPLIISRNGEEVGRMALLMAADDSITITGDLGAMEETIHVDSREYEAMRLYDRLNRNFQRLALFAQAGEISADSLAGEVSRWGDLYWEVYERHESTIGGKMSATEAIRLLEAQDREKMMNRLNQLRDKDDLVGLAATYGKNYLAQERGLDYTLAYMDTLQQITDQREAGKRIRMERIRLLYDSARTEDARSSLAAFEDDFKEDSTAIAWADDIGYDLSYLSPGDSIPPFSFADNGSVISRESLKGDPYLLEITSLSSRQYQDQYDRTVVIHSIYKNYGLKVVTLPLDESQVTIDAFFEERMKPWPVARHGSFDREQLLERFNIRLVPTRFLVDRNGLIVRKYVAGEFQQVIQGIQSVIADENQEL